jgi:hypothetical protein
MAGDVMLIEHRFSGGMRQPLMPDGIVAIDLDGQGGSRTHIGAAKAKAAADHEPQANIKVRVLQRLYFGADPRQRISWVVCPWCGN